MASFALEHLTFTYPGQTRPALSDLTLTIPEGAVTVLCGESGSGKSTLLRQLKTCLTPHGTVSGAVRLGDALLKGIPFAEQARRIGFVLQHPDDQIVTDKVFHELAFGLESLGCDEKTMRLCVAEMASYFGIADWFDRDVAALSGGQADARRGRPGPGLYGACSFWTSRRANSTPSRRAPFCTRCASSTRSWG